MSLKMKRALGFMAALPLDILSPTRFVQAMVQGLRAARAHQLR